MWGCACDVLSGHPCFGCCRVDRIAIDWQVCADQVSVHVVSCDSYLNLCNRDGSLSFRNVDLGSVGNGLAAPGGPDQEPFVGVDAAWDA